MSPHHLGLVGSILISGANPPAAGEMLKAQLAWKIDEATAQRLAAEGYDGSTKYLNYYEYMERMSRPFFVYYGMTELPAEGAFGYFAVNPWTGDVWALWGCRRLSTPALRKSQAEIRRRFSPKETRQYARLRRLKPECIVED